VPLIALIARAEKHRLLKIDLGASGKERRSLLQQTQIVRKSSKAVKYQSRCGNTLLAERQLRYGKKPNGWKGVHTPEMDNPQPSL
jgi:hypothetical protein